MQEKVAHSHRHTAFAVGAMPIHEGAAQARSGASRRAAGRVSSILVDGQGVFDAHGFAVGEVVEIRQDGSLIDSLSKRHIHYIF